MFGLGVRDCGFSSCSHNNFTSYMNLFCINRPPTRLCRHSGGNPYDAQHERQAAANSVHEPCKCAFTRLAIRVHVLRLSEACRLNLFRNPLKKPYEAPYKELCKDPPKRVDNQNPTKNNIDNLSPLRKPEPLNPRNPRP